MCLNPIPGEHIHTSAQRGSGLSDMATSAIRRTDRSQKQKAKPIWRWVSADGKAHEVWQSVGVVWHTLRHSWASWMRVAGVELADIQELGGWRDPRSVKRYSLTLMSIICALPRKRSKPGTVAR